jgi:hypothetical protein
MDKTVIENVKYLEFQMSGPLVVKMKVKIHSKRVENMQNSTRNEWRICKTPLETSGEYAKLHSKRVEKI